MKKISLLLTIFLMCPLFGMDEEGEAYPLLADLEMKNVGSPEREKPQEFFEDHDEDHDIDELEPNPDLENALQPAHKKSTRCKYLAARGINLAVRGMSEIMPYGVFVLNMILLDQFYKAVDQPHTSCELMYETMSIAQENAFINKLSRPAIASLTTKMLYDWARFLPRDNDVYVGLCCENTKKFCKILSEASVYYTLLSNLYISDELASRPNCCNNVGSTNFKSLSDSLLWSSIGLLGGKKIIEAIQRYIKE